MLDGIRACVFDAYGTLFDFGSAAARCGESLNGKGDALTRLWRDKQLQYTWLRSLQGLHADFWQITGDALDYALESPGLGGDGVRDRLMALYRTLDAYPEVASVLARLKERGVTTAIL